MKSAWIPLTFDDEEHKNIWDKFYYEFNFRASIYTKDWPGIKEPNPSVTYSISNIYGGENGEGHYDKLNKNLQDCFLVYFQALTKDDDWIFVLDWQHTTHKFYPHIHFDLVSLYNELPVPLLNEWPTPILPNGDYFIFLEPNLEFGVFGHPWEQTMCIFGQKLIDLVEKNPPLLFTKKLRVNGKSYFDVDSIVNTAIEQFTNLTKKAAQIFGLK